MKIKSIAAVGAMGAGLGIVSFIGGTGTASAACSDTPIPVGERVSCLAQSYTNTFLNGTDIDGVNDGLGVNPFHHPNQIDTFLDSTDPFNQLSTFQASLADFANGPRFP